VRSAIYQGTDRSPAMAAVAAKLVAPTGGGDVINAADRFDAFIASP
jgi:hypothetical protein